jgi:hypothetical protein
MWDAAAARTAAAPIFTASEVRDCNISTPARYSSGISR